MAESNGENRNDAYAQWRGTISNMVQNLTAEQRQSRDELNHKLTSVDDVLNEIRITCASRSGLSQDIAKLYLWLNGLQQDITTLKTTVAEHHSLTSHPAAMAMINDLKTSIASFHVLISEYPKHRDEVIDLAERLGVLEERGDKKQVQADHDMLRDMMTVINGKNGLIDSVQKMDETLTNVRLKLAAWAALIGFVGACIPIAIELILKACHILN
jgi:chromosome segregation ATPase